MTKKYKICVMGLGDSGSKIIELLSRKQLLGADLIALNETELKTLNQKSKVNALGVDYGSKLKYAIKDSPLTFLCFKPEDKLVKVELPKVVEICKSSKTFLALVIIASDNFSENLREDLLEQISQPFGTIVMDGLNLGIVTYFLKNLVEGIALPNLVGLNLSEIIELLSVNGVATLGVGHSTTEAIEKATKQALEIPFLKVDHKKMKGTRVYAYFTGGPDMRLDDLNKAGDLITKKLDSGTDLIWGARVEEEMKGNVTVMVLLTGLK